MGSASHQATISGFLRQARYEPAQMAVCRGASVYRQLQPWLAAIEIIVCRIFSLFWLLPCQCKKNGQTAFNATGFADILSGYNCVFGNRYERDCD